MPSADSHRYFPVQNLPLGILSPRGEEPRTAIGDHILELPAMLAAGLSDGEAASAAVAAAGPVLNPLLGLRGRPRRVLRSRMSTLHLRRPLGDCQALPPPGRRLHHAPSGPGWRFHRLLCRHPLMPPMSAGCSVRRASQITWAIGGAIPNRSLIIPLDEGA